MHRFNVARIRFAEVGDPFENAQGHGPIDCAQLRPRFRSKGEAHGLVVTEEFFYHFIVILADNCISGVCLRNPSANRRAESRADGFLCKELQEALGCRDLGIRKTVDQVMKGIAV